MKKIGKLNITPEKVMKNEELLLLKGGSNIGIMYQCTCRDAPIFPYPATWWGCYSSQSDRVDAMQAHCSNGIADCQEYYLC